MNMKWKEDDVVLCIVKRIEGTTVFLELEDGTSAQMVLSEVAAGRIRNLRNYVTPGKIVVCKVLRISGDRIEMSLRRVTGKERERILESNKKEKILKGMLKAVVENPAKIIEKIKEEYDILDFFESVQENPRIFEKFLPSKDAEKIVKIFSDKREKDKFVEKNFFLKSLEENGVEDIRHILDVNAEIHYLGSSRFSILIKGKDFKEANNKLEEVLREIEKRAKIKGAIFEILREK